jgi:transposase
MNDRPEQGNEFGLISVTLGGLPIVNLILERLGLPALLARALPDDDARLKLAPAVAIRLVITNLVLGREPLYGLGEWAGRHDPGLLGLSSGDLQVLNDDRVGRALEALFDADRASLLTAVVLRAINEFNIATDQLHNDSTSISVHGAYTGAIGTERGGKPTPVITFGHSKDHRPDLKQLVWILTVSADGAVPITYRLADGNTSDDPTHVPTWDGLVGLLGRTDFLYVADSKLCSRAAMGHITGKGGRFVTLLPRSRAEDDAFREHLQTHTPIWTEAARRPGGRHGDPDEVYSTTPAPLPSAEGYRIVWVHSTAKTSRDAATRRARVESGVAALEALDVKLAGPRSRFKTRVAVEAAATSAVTDAHAQRWVTFTVTETITKTYKQAHAGRPGPGTNYREIPTSHFTVHGDIKLDQVAYDAASDGCFPLHAARRVMPHPRRTPCPARGRSAREFGIIIGRRGMREARRWAGSALVWWPVERSWRWRVPLWPCRRECTGSSIRGLRVRAIRRWSPRRRQIAKGPLRTNGAVCVV